MSPVNKYKKVENKVVEVVSKQLSAFFGKISSTFNNLINSGKQRFTVMLIPHSEKKIFNFRISVFSLIVMVFLLGCMLTAFVIFTTQFKGMSGMLANQTDTLEKKESDLEIIRDQIAELKSVSKVFEASLSKTLGTLGIENSNIGSDKKSFIGSDFASEDGITDTSEMLRELEDLKTLSSFLNESVESFKEITGLLESQGELLVELPTMWPLKNVRGRITNYFGPSVHPFTRKWYLHKGIDLAYKKGTPIVATANGKVVEKGYEPLGFGNYLVIRHRYGFFTKYAHLDHKVYVKEGQTVTQGQIIGRMGNTGLSTGPHLHYEVRIGSQVVDPERYLNIKNRLGN